MRATPAREGSEHKASLAARAAHWSANHRKAAILGWVGFVLVAAIIGQLVTQKTIFGADQFDGESGRAEHALEGMGRAIDVQFGTWQLTPAERDIALMLLKGYSHKLIAKETDRSPQTVRQHAAAVYRKAGLGGRAELSAFFLEELLLPRDRLDALPVASSKDG